MSKQIQERLESGFEVMKTEKSQGIIRRLLVTQRHLIGLAMGSVIASIRVEEGRAKPGEGKEPAEKPSGWSYRLRKVLSLIYRPFISSELVDLPFPEQFRRRLEILGPTYIKLGQVLSLREDLLPREITRELKNLLDHLPVVRFERFRELVSKHLGRDVDEIFSHIDSQPLGSASIAQIHRATTVDGEDVIIKLVKPTIRATLRRDAILLKIFGRFLQLFLGRFQPKRVIDEFVNYTLREVDLRLEADNAETFRANFKDLPGVAFPKIYRQYSAQSVLTMEFFDGYKPSDQRLQEMSDKDREKLIDLGSAAIIRMLYRDGFFHADLHPGNLLILEGPRCGFIDLGMVGRFDEELRRTLLYYFYCLVMKDAENASRYLVSVADPGPGADPVGFRRDIEDTCRRWTRAANFEEFSLAQLMLESVGRAGHYRMYFPVEMVLMVKALVTFEGVGQMLLPGFDVVQLSKAHVNKIFMAQFNPLRIAKEGLRGAPEMVDALVKAPMLVTEGLRFLEKTTRSPPENPLSGLRGTLFAGFSLVSAAIVLAFDGPWPVTVLLFLLAFALILRKGR